MSSKPTICVTGASGYIASVLIASLLERGYNVHGTVRSVADKYKTEHLYELGNGKPGKLTLFEADLLRDGSFDAAIAGCEYVFHTASPFIISVADPQRDLIDPALLGTRNVLMSCVRYKPTIKRVIVTSSVAAIRGVGAVPVNGKIFTEEDWNEIANINNFPYPYSKKLAEEEAWKLAKEHGLDLVTINPSLVVGPPASKRVDGTSIEGIKNLMEGRPRPNNFCVVDVRDVVAAHIAAMEKPEAKGRHIISNRRPLQPSYAAEVVKRAFPELPIDVEAHKKYDHTQNPPDEWFDNTKVQAELGVTLHPVEESLVDMAKSLLEYGIVKRQ